MTRGHPPGLIETLRVREGATPLASLHVRRLSHACRDLGIPFPRSLELPEGGADRVHRLEVDRDGVRTSERPVGSTLPVRLVTVSVPHPGYPHKSTDRGAFELAAAEALAAGADDALLLTRAGEVAEATIWSLFWWEADALCAPALELGVLPGAARARLAEVVGELVERRVRLAELAGRPLFAANAARGVVPVATLDGHPVPWVEATAALAARFWP
jgi:branched-subunit amino acid aminotransferase/4-amino-4-deoxychorismate lyase